MDLSEKLCPCAAGWHCDETREVCVPGRAPRRDAGELDAGPDAGRGMDAGSSRSDAGFDAGPQDGGSDAGADGGSDAGPDDTRCDDLHAGAIFCDGLETPGFTAWASTYMSDGFVGRAEDQTFMGLGSLYAQVDAAGGRASARKLYAARDSGDVYLRAWVYLPGDVALPSGFSILQAGEDTSPYHHVSIGAHPTGTELFINAPGTSEVLRACALAEDDWTCVEVHVRLHATDGLAEYWLNDVLQGQVTSINTVPAAGYDRIVVGIPYTPTDQPTARVYVDEIVFDDERVGCD